MPNEFEPIETQEDFDRAIKERLRRKRERVESKYADHDELKAKVASLEEAAGSKDGDLE